MTNTTTVQPLQARDVEIGYFTNQGFLITTTQDSYRTVRTCLSYLKDKEGLPVEFASEKEGLKYAGFFQMLGKTIPEDLIIQEEGLHPRVDNHFIIPGYRKVGTDLTKIKALAEQVAGKLRALYLKVEVNEESSMEPKMTSEEEFIYTVMVTILAHSIAKVPKDDEVWVGVPPIIKIMLLTGEMLAVKEIMGGTPPLLEVIDSLLESYETKLTKAISKCEGFKEAWNPENSKECIAKLEIEPPVDEAKKILKILQQYHQS